MTARNSGEAALVYAAVGSPVRTLRPEICAEEELKGRCELFQATFGVGEDRP